MATPPARAQADYNYLIKLLLTGEDKRRFWKLRFSDGSFTTSFISTIGIDCKIRTIELDGTSSKLQIWGTAGQEHFQTITTGSSLPRGERHLLVSDVMMDIINIMTTFVFCYYRQTGFTASSSMRQTMSVKYCVSDKADMDGCRIEFLGSFLRMRSLITNLSNVKGSFAFNYAFLSQLYQDQREKRMRKNMGLSSSALYKYV